MGEDGVENRNWSGIFVTLKKLNEFLIKIMLLMLMFSLSFYFCWIVRTMPVFNSSSLQWSLSTCSLFSSLLLSLLAFLQGSLFGARFYPIQGWHAHSILFQERPFYSFPRPAGIFLKSFPIIMAYLMFQVPLALAFSHNTPDSLMRQRLFVLTGGGQNS